MADFLRPVSTQLTQHINPWQFYFQPQFNTYQINLGRSRAPDVEAEVLGTIGSYGRQLGRIGDALGMLMAHFKPEKPLSRDEQKALASLRRMLEDIGEIKEADAKRRPA
jgi:hypothetical protein